MFSFLDPIRYITYDNSLLVAVVRLTVAAFCGGVIGLERAESAAPQASARICWFASARRWQCSSASIFR